MSTSRQINIEKIYNPNKRQKINKNNNNHRIQRIINILQKSKISEDNYSSSKQPFFMQNNIYNFNISNESINDTYIKKLPNSLNNNIKLIYKILNNPNKEIYLNEWTIMNLNDAIKIYEKYCKDGQKNIFDIGYKYEGMGHITVISCDLNNHLLFYRPDGGSNGYDRELNYKNLIVNGSTPYKKFYFSKWFCNIYD